MPNTDRIWGTILIVIGIVLAVTGVVGLLAFSPIQQETIASALESTPMATPSSRPTLTPEESVRVHRNVPAETTHIPTLTPFFTPTLLPATPIPWTQEELNALSWLCYSEIRGMAERRVDACLSVVSTVRQRYAYANEFDETDIAGTLARPRQFPVEIHFDYPAPDQELYWAVTQYQYGARGSCNGYLYYDSVPGGPSLCVVRASNGQWEEFHNGWD